MPALPAPPPAEAVVLPACLVAALRAGSPAAGPQILAFTHAADLRRLGVAVSARQLGATFGLNRHVAARVLALVEARPHDQGTTPTILGESATPEIPAIQPRNNADYRGVVGHSQNSENNDKGWPTPGHTTKEQRRLSRGSRPQPETQQPTPAWPTPGHAIEDQTALLETFRPPRPHDRGTTPTIAPVSATTDSVADPRPHDQGTTPILRGESATASITPKRRARSVADPRPHDRGQTPLFGGVSANGAQAGILPPPHPPIPIPNIDHIYGAPTHTHASAPTRARTRGEDRFVLVVSQRWSATSAEIDAYLLELRDSDGGPPTDEEMARWEAWLGKPGCFVRNWRKDFLRTRGAVTAHADAPSGEHPPITEAAARGVWRGFAESQNGLRSIRAGDVPPADDEPPSRRARAQRQTPGGDQ